MKISGADMLMQALHKEGVELIFGYPGGAALHVYDALFRQKDIEHILVRHEQGATHAADGYARSTGKPGVVLVTSGPGATNAVTGIATAFMDSIPMVVLSCQVASHLIGTDAFQETDMIGISRPIVKHSFTIEDQQDIPRIIKEAFHIAMTGRQGPVVIDIPKDMTAPDKLFDFAYPDEVNIRSYNPPVEPSDSQVQRAVNAILSAKKPVLYAGGGAISSNASNELLQLNEILKAPVTNTLMGLGVYPASDKYFLGMLGMHGTYQANMAMHNSDLIIAIGARFDDRITNTPSLFGCQLEVFRNFFMYGLVFGEFFSLFLATTFTEKNALFFISNKSLCLLMKLKIDLWCLPYLMLAPKMIASYSLSFFSSKLIGSIFISWFCCFNIFPIYSHILFV